MFSTSAWPACTPGAPREPSLAAKDALPINSRPAQIAGSPNRKPHERADSGGPPRNHLAGPYGSWGPTETFRPERRWYIQD